MGQTRGSSACCVWLAPIVLCLQVLTTSGAWTSVPGGAGYGMLFDDSVLSLQGLKGIPATGLKEFTFEAWVSTTDNCHESTIMSYARSVVTKNDLEQDAAANHFIVYNTKDLIACHDFSVLHSSEDNTTTCEAAFKAQKPKPAMEAIDDVDKDTAVAPISVVSRDNGWHHVAVTWAAATNGTISIYVDGALRAAAATGKVQPIAADGLLMLGQDQDCYGGCTNSFQAFYGIMDEVRVWKVARTHEEIAQNMRAAHGLAADDNLLAYWKFDDPIEDAGSWKSHNKAVDSSKYGNNLTLINPPKVFSPKNASKPIKQGSRTLAANQLVFQRNYLLGLASNVPAGSFTLEFWARGNTLPNTSSLHSELKETYFSFSTTNMPGEDAAAPKKGKDVLSFLDDAIKVERVLVPARGRNYSKGLIRVSVNSNSQAGAGYKKQSFDTVPPKQQMAQFDAGWTDAEWHHVAVTWDQTTGYAQVFLDGQQKQEVGITKGSTAIGKQNSERVTKGSLTIGMDQNCFMGCFDESSAATGAIAAVRLWGLVRKQGDIQKTMWNLDIGSSEALAWQLLFRDEDSTFHFNYNFTFSADKSFPMRFDSPRPAFVYSTAPLIVPSGAPVPVPQAGAAGTALLLSDMQLVMVPNFKNFPSTAITVEFWLKTIDKCRKGSPFSYAAGDYGHGDNAFLITNQMDWIVSIMEDQGLAQESSGVSSANGQWQHITVTWELESGRTILYLNANPMWWVERNKGGKPLPTNGTLVIGREQDCRGGCFDSAKGAVGRTSTMSDEEYGSQDFFGAVEEMRVWNIALDAGAIRRNIQYDVGAAGTRGLDPREPNLVAYWKFDEGRGYVVKDETLNGNDLLIMSEPKWEVVKWLSFCGDGLVAGDEECDDGNDDGLDGCTPDCKVSPGWYCDTGSFPSMCYKIDDLFEFGIIASPPPSPDHTLPPRRPEPEYTPQPQHTPVPTPSTFPVPRPGSSGTSSSQTGGTSSTKTATHGQSSGKKGMSGGMVFLVVLLCLLGVVGAGAAWMQRDVLLASVAHLLPGNRPRDGWSPMATDLEELNLGFQPSMQSGTPDYAPVPAGPHEERL